MQYFPVFLLILTGLVLIARPLTVLLHELGHAILAIVLTKQKVTVYIGSYGDPKNSIEINLGKLLIFFRYNPFAWRLGLCVPSAKTIPINRQIAYTLAGPLASLTIAGIACYITFTYNLHGLIKLFLIVFLASALLDLFINLIPKATPIKLHDGRLTHNDGHSLKQLFYNKRFLKQYSVATGFYNEQKFHEAAIFLEKLLRYTEDENVYRFAIHSFLQDGNYAKAKNISDEFLLTGNMNADDLANMAMSYSQLGCNDEALKLYDKALRLNPENIYALNNKGYTLNLMDKHAEAICLFDKAIDLDKTFAYSYNNRGLAKIKLGRIDEGLQDINRSFDLDPQNAYNYRNLGIYHFDKCEFNEALRLFTRAKELDSNTHMIDELIHKSTLQLQ